MHERPLFFYMLFGLVKNANKDGKIPSLFYRLYAQRRRYGCEQHHVMELRQNH